MTTSQITPGTIILFTVDNTTFTLTKITDKRISYNYSEAFKSSTGINTMRVGWMSLKQFERGIEKGTYVIQGA